MSAESKLSNPKDAIGSNKVPMSLVPASAVAYCALGMMEGMLKYGMTNWRECGVKARIYVDAAQRHLAKYFNGEWEDAETHVPHLASAMACIAILIDAHECGKLVDDRPIQAPVSQTIDRLSENVKHLREFFKNENPHHYLHVPTKPTK